MLGPKKSKIFDLKNFHFHTIFNEKISIFSISKNFEKTMFGIFSFFFRSKIFHWKLYENEKFWDRKFSIFFGPKKIRTLWGPKLTVLLEILIFLPRIKTWWKLCSSTFHKSMVSLCSGHAKQRKVYSTSVWHLSLWIRQISCYINPVSWNHTKVKLLTLWRRQQ